MTTVAKKNTNTMDDVLALQELDMEALKERANELGVELEESWEQAQVIDAVVAAQMENVEAVEPSHDVLFALTTPDDAAAFLIRQARNKILANKAGNIFFTVYQQNAEGDSFERRMPGCRCTLKNLDKVIRLIKFLDDDGHQESVLQEFQNDPSQFQDPLLVYKNSRNANGSYSNYVMFCLRRKQDPDSIVEQAF